MQVFDRNTTPERMKYISVATSPSKRRAELASNLLADSGALTGVASVVGEDVGGVVGVAVGSGVGSGVG